MRHPFLLIVLFTFSAFGQDAPEVVMTTGHNDQVNEMVVSDDGRFLASASNNKIIKIWEIASAREYRTISGTDGRVDQLAFSQDNIHMAGVSQQNELNVWNVLSGEEVFEGPASSTARGLAFFDDGKKLIFINENHRPTVLTVESGERVSFDVVCMGMQIDRSKGIAYSLDHLGNMLKLDLKTVSVLETYALFSEVNVPFSRGDITDDGRYISWGFNDDVMRIFDTRSGSFILERKYSSKIVTTHFDQDQPYLYVSTHAGSVNVFDYKKKESLVEINESVFNAQCLTDHPNGEVVIMATSAVIRFYDVKRKKAIKVLEPKVFPITNMAYDQNGQYLAVALAGWGQLNVQLWDLSLNKVVRTIPGYFPCDFTPDGKYLIASTAATSLGVFDVSTGKQVKSLNTNYQLMQEMAVSADGKKVTASGYMRNVMVWDFESGKLEAEMAGHEQGILDLDFHPTQPWIATASHDQTVRIWDYEKKKEIQRLEGQGISVGCLKFSPDGKYLATGGWDWSVWIRNTKDWTIEKKMEGHVNVVKSIDWSADGKYVVTGAGNNAVAAADNSIIYWEAATGKIHCQINDHDAEIVKVLYDKSSDRVFSASMDGTVKLTDPKSCAVVATYLSTGDQEFMIYTPDNYYMASRAALKGIAFRINNQLVPFEQFDNYLNRPDIVAQRIGKSPEQLIKAYQYIYKKRLRKLNMDEGSLKIDYHLPKILNETNLDLVTTNESIELWVKAWDDVYDIKQFNVYVNDVPIFGENGFRPAKKVQSYRKQFKIPLLPGVNRVQLSCLNSNGAESLYETIEVIRDVDEKKNDLYVAGIGVSNYQDDRFTLKYPSKDAKDVVDKLQESAHLYKQVHTKLLLDEQVTVDAFASLVNFFSSCSHEDIAIIFIAGHGVLNVDFDYFYGTYDMDFDQPEKRGLAYDEIHNLLNSLKAYRKLLIMDTCHSGELDKEEIEHDDGPIPEVEDGDIQFRNAGAGVRQKTAFGFQNSLEFMQDVFSDTRKGSGATVISSAGGAEYAMESDQWRNGLFTYTFLKGLTTFEANLNGDNRIDVSEIRTYVNRTVKELSGGNQIPSSREENISQDYTIFGR